MKSSYFAHTQKRVSWQTVIFHHQPIRPVKKNWKLWKDRRVAALWSFSARRKKFRQKLWISSLLCQKFSETTMFLNTKASLVQRFAAVRKVLSTEHNEYFFLTMTFFEKKFCQVLKASRCNWASLDDADSDRRRFFVSSIGKKRSVFCEQPKFWFCQAEPTIVPCKQKHRIFEPKMCLSSRRKLFPKK